MKKSKNPKKSTKRPPDPLTKRQAVAVLKRAGDNRYKTLGERNAAAIAVMWRSQLRVAELCSLRVEDYEEDRLRVLNGKGGWPRVVGLDEQTKALIELWLEVRPDSEYLFCTQKGTKIDTSYFRHLLKRIQADVNFNKRIHPHGLRHTGAMELAKENVPLPFIANQLGHTNCATTHEYLRVLSSEDVVGIINKRGW